MANASGAEKLKGLALKSGALAVTLPEVDVIVVSIPLIGILKLPQRLLENTSANTTIIDTCNYYPITDGIIEAIEDGMPESV